MKLSPQGERQRSMPEIHYICQLALLIARNHWFSSLPVLLKAGEVKANVKSGTVGSRLSKHRLSKH